MVYPSLYEGFGLPVLEAMSMGTPVVTSKSGATQEIAGDAAYLADPYAESDIENGIDQILDNPDYHNNLIEKGFEKVNSFSWEKCTHQTYQVYQKVLGKIK